MSIEKFGIDTSDMVDTIFPGGESEGLERLRQKMKDEEWVRKFEKPKTSPNSL